MHFFGRLSFLVDENAHAVHFFISALLQLLDRAGSLYGELARFALRLIFRRHPLKEAAMVKAAGLQVPALPASGGPVGSPMGMVGTGPMGVPLGGDALGGGLGLGAPRTSQPVFPSTGQWDNLWSES